MRRTICTGLSRFGRPKELSCFRNRRVPNGTKAFAFAVAAVLGLAVILSNSEAGAQTTLGTAADFGVLAGSTVTNTGPSVIQGDVGVSPGSAVVGFPPGSTPTGTIHAGDAVAAQAQSDLTIAYDDLMGRPFDVDLTGQDLGGKVLIPGVYAFSSSAQLTGLRT